MTLSIVELLETNAERTRENVYLMGYEVLVRWMLMLGGRTWTETSSGHRTTGF